MENPVNTITFSERFAKHIYTKGETNEELFKVLNHCIDALGLKTAKEVSVIENTSVQNVYKKYKKDIINILGVKVVVYD